MRLSGRRATPVELLVAATVVVVLLGVVADLVHHHIQPARGIRLMVALSGEANLPTWWSAMLLLTGAVLAGLAALSVRRAGRPLQEVAGWTAVAAALTALSLDEAVQLHERLAVLAPFLPTTGTYLWVVPGVLVAGVGLTCLLVVSRALPRAVRRRLAGAAALYLGGAVGVESVNGWVSRNRGIGDLYRLSTALEESLEMAGSLLAIATLLTALRHAGPLALPSVRRVVQVLVVSAATAVALLLPVAPDSPMGYHVLLWREGNTTTWIQSGVWWCAAAALLLAASRSSGSRRTTLAAVAGVSVLVSASEMARLHELVGRITVPPEPFWGGPRWAPAALAAALLAVVALRLGRTHLPGPLAGRLTGALTVLGVAAVGGDALEALLATSGPFVLRVLAATASETFELLAGLCVLVLALALMPGARGQVASTSSPTRTHPSSPTAA